MATYAMICNNTIIDVLYEQNREPHWPPDPSGNQVISIECVPEATRDWLYDPETNTIYEPVYTEPEEPEYVENEYEQYYNMVNAAILGGE